MKVLVLGHGSMGRRHAANAHADGYDVLAYDTDARVVLSERYHITTDEDAAWSWAPDVAIIATPAQSHARLLRTARARAKHTFVEKPLSLSTPFVSDMLAGVPGRVEMVGYNLRFHPGIAKLREKLGATGGVTQARFVMRCDKSKWPGMSYADMLLEASHEIDLALWLLGPARLVGAVGEGERWTLLLHHDSGAASTIVLDGAYGSYWREIEVCGPNGALTHTWQDHVLDWRWKLSGVCTGIGIDGAVTPNELYQRELRVFMLCAAEGTLFDERACTVRQAAAVLDVCDAARKVAAGCLR